MVIKADALHYKTDLYVNIAVLVSLVVVYLTKWEIVDVLIGAAISIFIIYSAYELIEEGVLVLLDRAIDDNIVEQIETIFGKVEKINGYHFLKTRTAGNCNFVDVHLVFNCEISLLEAHKIADIVEDKIKILDNSKEWIINIHMDPYDDSEINNNEQCIITQN
jgi:cation diffusion facilitator family transporter